jgi:large subunit ribosomal protein L17
MRHRLQSRKLGRHSAHRLALYRNMVTSLLDCERIQTTDAKAREVRRIADRMITLGKRGSLHARRRALRVIRSREVTAKVFDDLAERFRDRPGGYTRVLKLRTRAGDAAPISIVELVDAKSAEAPEEKKKAKRAPRKAAAAEAAPARPARKKAESKKAESKQAAPKKTAPKRAEPKQSARRKGASRATSAKKTD